MDERAEAGDAAGNATTLLPPPGPEGSEPTQPGNAGQTPNGDDVLARERVAAALFEASQPRRVGRYLVLEQLGAGGMGEVYAAYDPELDRRLAIKFILAARAGTDADRTRLLREAQALARLSHPNVVQVYDVGVHQGLVYVAMEYIAGRTLGQWMRRHSGTWNEVLEVFLRAGRGLEAAHDHQLVHRDFKPDNVLVGSDGQVRVLDFGLARAVTQPEDLHPTAESGERRVLGVKVTRDGALIGTPAYMSPEQFSGEAADERSDQFSFCVALFEALHGRRPFSGNSFTELATSVIRGELEGPFNPSVPKAVDAIVRQGLAVEPGDRWPSMRALLDALSGESSGKSRRRRMIWLVVGGLFGLFAALFGVQRIGDVQASADCVRDANSISATWNPALRAKANSAAALSGLRFAPDVVDRVTVGLDDYAAHWREARQRVCVDATIDGVMPSELYRRSRACSDERRAEFSALVELLSTPDEGVLQEAPLALANLSSLEDCADQVRLRQAAPPPEDETVRLAAEQLQRRLGVATVLAAAGRYEQADADAREALDEATALGYRPIISRAELVAGITAEKRGDYDRAREHLEHAFEAATVIGQDRLAARAASQLTLVVGNRIAEHSTGLSWGLVAQALLDRLGVVHAPASADLLNNIGTVQYSAGQHPAALDSWTSALAIRQETLGKSHPAIAVSFNNLGAVNYSMGRYQEAIASFEQALEVWEVAFGPSHPETATALANLGGVYDSYGSDDRALEYYTRALATWEAALGKDHSDVAAALFNLGDYESQHGNYEAAETHLLRAQAIWVRELGGEHPLVANAVGGLAVVHMGRGEYERAIAGYEQAIAIEELARGSDSMDLALTRTSLAVAYKQTREYRKARELLDRAIGILERDAPDHPGLASAIETLGMIAFEEKRYAEARDLLVRGSEMASRVLGEGHPLVARSGYVLAAVDRAEGKLEAARRGYEASLESWERASGPDHADLGYPLTGLGELLIEKGQFTRALPMLERAHRLRADRPGVRIELAETNLLLARALWATHEQDRARTLVDRSIADIASLAHAPPELVAALQSWRRKH